MTTTDTNEEFLTTREVAKRLGVSQSTVQGWVKSGALPAWKTIGGHRRIPASKVEEMRLKQISLLNPALQEYPVLLVEDNTEQMQTYRNCIAESKLPIVLHTADNAVQGLMMVGQFQPKLIITDLAMPEIDGMKMITQLLSLGLSPQSIVVLTDQTYQDTDALPDGIEVYNKPLDPEDFRNLIETKCDRRSSAQRRRTL